MSGVAAIVFVLATAIVLGLLVWHRRRGGAAGPDGTAAGPPGSGQTAPESTPPQSAPVGANELESELAAATTRLWSGALSSQPFEPGIPPEHEPLLLAARQALAADRLAERYFPRRPLLMPQLLAAVNDADAPPLKLAGIIAQDPVLTGNILRLANSVYFRPSAEPVESIQRAVVVCGTDGLQSLAATALVQPVFRADAADHSHFPAALWERCTQASFAAEKCARLWCPGDRQAAQLLALLSALGPLVAYRVVQDLYRAQAALAPSAAVFLAVIDRYSRVMAARIAALWQSPSRIVAVLRDGQAGEPLPRALRSGELLATLALLAKTEQASDDECRSRALAAGIPATLFGEIWVRCRPPAGRQS